MYLKHCKNQEKSLKTRQLAIAILKSATFTDLVKLHFSNHCPSSLGRRLLSIKVISSSNWMCSKLCESTN